MGFNAFVTILQHEFLLEFRHRFSLAALLIYVVAVVFIMYLSIAEMESAIWNSLFWIVILFSGIQSGSLAFTREFGNSHLFYYQLLPPIHLFFAKVLSVWVKLFGLSLVAWLIMSVVLGDPILKKEIFFLAIGLGTLGFGSIFSFLSAIAMNTSNSGLLLPVLGFPVLLPVLLSVINLTTISMAPRPLDYGDSLMTLMGVVMLVLAMGLFLFPYLWKN